MVKVRTTIMGFMLIIFFIGMASADFTIGNLSYSLDKYYAPESSLRGWVNISFESQSADSVLESSIGENSSISLINLLKTVSNSNFIYECRPLSCKSDYSASNEETSKIFNLNENESILVGFNISGKKPLSAITSFSMDIKSNNPETERLPLSIDVLNDGQEEWYAYTASDNFGVENTGCFIGISTDKAFISSTPYCERIALSKSPKVEIGAYVEGNNNIYFEMRIKKAEGSDSYKTCTASTTGAEEIDRVGCVPSDFSITEEGNYFVCIKTISEADKDRYEIGYEDRDPCGFTGEYENLYDYDFEIFARPKLYNSSINFTLNNAELVKSQSLITNIEEYMKDYISETYNNNCSKECVIPVRIFSGIVQQIELTNVYLSYFAGISTVSNKSYNIQEKPAEINSKSQLLYFDDAGFNVPEEYGNYSVSIKMDDTVLLSDDIFVREFAAIQSLTPMKTAIKYPTKFTIKVSSIENITTYNWDFGDNTLPSVTAEPSVTHTYNAVGTYILKIDIIDINGRNASKEFNITVGPASEIVPSLLIEVEENLDNIKDKIAGFSQFEQKSINNALNLDGIRNEVIQLKDAASKATFEQEYETILGELLEIKIPETVSKSAVSEGILFYPEQENINLEILKKISGGDYEKDKEDKYKEAVLAWDEENTAMTMTYNEVSAVYENYEEPFLRVFDIHITKQGEDDAYIIIKDMKTLLFEEDYSEKEDSGYNYILLKEKEKEISFSTTENVDFVSLPMFISPGISKLTLAEYSPFEKEGENKRGVILGVIIVFIILIAAGVWIILQLWYKRKYENYLFKDRNQLYNIVNYIETEKRKGINEKDISSRLRKTGWTSEQVTYALRKYMGKSTGMPEIIPIEKIFNMVKNIINKTEKKNFPKKNT